MLSVPRAGLSHVHRSLEALVDPVREIGGGNRRDKLDDLFLIEVLAEGVDVVLVNSTRISGESFCEMDCRLLIGLEERSLPAAGLFRRRDLIVGDATPLRRRGLGAPSVFATVENRRPQVRKFLGSRRHLALAPDLLIERYEGLQDVRLVRQYFVEIDDLATFLFEFVVNGNGWFADLLLFQRRDFHWLLHVTV